MPEWASSYINYKDLKKLVKVASQAAERGEIADLAGGKSLASAAFFCFSLPLLSVSSCHRSCSAT